MKLKLLTNSYSVLRYAGDTPCPVDLNNPSELLSITRTHEEFSIVCPRDQNLDAAPNKREDGWSAFKVEGPLDFALTGILSSIAAPLADAKISIFALSTFDTDYILIKTTDIKKAEDVLTSSGFEIIE
jgi:hypothetical protein